MAKAADDHAAETTRGHGQNQRKADGAYIVVSGAGGGIGLAVVRRLRSDGWHVLATDYSESALAPLREEFGGDAGTRITVMDVANRKSIDQAASLLADVQIAGLVNVAGLLQDVYALLDMDAEIHRKIWNVNYFGAEQCIQVFAPEMKKLGGGSIVNITSINEIRPLPLHAYAPSKVALGALTQLAAGDLGRFGIRVNSVAPGFTLTPAIQAKFESGARSPDLAKNNSALGRCVGIDEVASAVSFLVSDDSSAITGASLPVDAGWLVRSHWMNMSELIEDRSN